MNKILLSTIMGISLWGSQTVELVCDKGYPPYSYKDGKKAKGVYVDVIKTAFNKLPQYDVKFKAIAWKKAISYVQSGKAIGFFPPYFNKDREAWTKFSTPILTETSVVFAKEKILKGKKKFPEDFLGLTVCMNRGFSISSVAGTKLAKMVDSGSINIKRGNTNQICLNQLKTNKADFYVNDQLIDTKNFPSIKRGLKVKQNNGYIGFTLKDDFPYKNDLISKLNKVINQMKKDGEIDKILQQNIDEK